jgi:hypothetical protein
MAFGNFLMIEVLSPFQSCFASLEPEVSRINKDLSAGGKLHPSADAGAKFTPNEVIMISSEKETMPALRLKPSGSTTIPLFRNSK